MNSNKEYKKRVIKNIFFYLSTILSMLYIYQELIGSVSSVATLFLLSLAIVCGLGDSDNVNRVEKIKNYIIITNTIFWVIYKMFWGILVMLREDTTFNLRIISLFFVIIITLSVCFFIRGNVHTYHQIYKNKVFIILLWNMILDVCITFLSPTNYLPQYLNIGELETGNLIEIFLSNKYYLFVLAVIVAPLVEEVIFRRVLFKTIHKRHIVGAYIISSVVFGFAHVSIFEVLSGEVSPLSLLGVIPHIYQGFVFAYIYDKVGGLKYAIAAHMFNNFAAIGLFMCI